MPRINIYLTVETEIRLRAFLKKRYKGHNALSLEVQRAINEYLDKEERRDNITTEKG